MSTPITTQTTHALKEWHVAVEALAQGDMILLLRKGGIRDRGGKFAIQHDRVLLFPTYEHQKPHLLKPAYASQVETVEPGWHPTSICLKAWADITDTLEVNDSERVIALSPFHIWNEAFIAERLQWKPDTPLVVLLLRVHQLDTPTVLPYESVYGGCKSWIDVEQAIALDHSHPVLTESEYRERTEAIRAVLCH